MTLAADSNAGAAPATIRVNGVDEPLAAGTLGELLAARGIVPGARGVAVALDGTVVPAADWAGTRLAPGAEIEIVRPFQGG
ncbi:sulfur carrier protein ThiS [Arenibaculum pallidiluteum]|uniref:sulfur carrier protein ThiS n=1 Tax=Arenibaculum pallidiluteum TaxID=2812559 RepID=UPI001A967F7B|nr:sulfur carrier protein ThiS [Arenibaculum pallidiluteum]